MIALLKTWNDKYDFWSFFSDFIFVFGVIILDWNPILLVFLFVIDSGVMSLFSNILFFLEYKSFIKSFGFLMASTLMLFCMLALFQSIFQFMRELGIEGMEDRNTWETLAAYIQPVLQFHVLPIVLISSGLNHYAAFDESLQKRKEGTYSSSFIKHFFLRYVFLMGVILLMVIGQHYFNATLVIGLIIIKAILRLWKRKYRTII
jgi:hypothetical protein